MPSSSHFTAASKIDPVDVMRAIDTPAQIVAEMKYTPGPLKLPQPLIRAMEAEALWIKYMILNREMQILEQMRAPKNHLIPPDQKNDRANDENIYKTSLRKRYITACLAEDGTYELHYLIEEFKKNALTYIDSHMPLPGLAR